MRSLTLIDGVLQYWPLLQDMDDDEPGAARGSAAAARGTKRSRTAEVHSLSERVSTAGTLLPSSHTYIPVVFNARYNR
jgi:hypothetical protein